jgi:hypothetical protein
MAAVKILPGTGRGTKTRSGLVEGALHIGRPEWRAPSTTGYAGGPPPRTGEELS